jgi:extradiol dioxygenase family protein
MLSAAADSGLSARIRPVALTPFHVALQVRDLAEARRFYGDTLGCSEGRSAPDWVDFNMYGHQFVCHLNPQRGPGGRIGAHFNPLDGHGVPVPHCGVVLEPPQRRALAARLRATRSSG